MRYLSFTIHDYRAIKEPLFIDTAKKTLIPIIGINECGKTTILNGLFAFDEINDGWNKGRHLKNFHNLYSTERPPAIVEATIESTSDELVKAIKIVELDTEIPSGEKRGARILRQEVQKWKEPLVIQRNLDTKKYIITNTLFEGKDTLSHHIAREIVKKCPYILYFDDFTESVEGLIEIKKEEDESLSPWLSIMEQLFKTTNSSYSVFKLKEMDELRRRSIISDITKRLNETLTTEWSRFSLEERSILKVIIDYKEEGDDEYLSVQIQEDIDGKERFFGIRDRSKGFFWFFNFVMKLEFNPKVRELGDKDTIYLLDEPGSYLHANAQSRLCEKLGRLSKNNIVIYCTHSHYLLNPDFVPINSVQVVKKDEKGAISMKSVAEVSDHIMERRGAFQPLLDALQIKPLVFDYNIENLILVEGIYDYYVFELFKGKMGKGAKKFNFFPGVNAHSILYNISFTIFAGTKYLAMWDDDEEGREEFKRAKKYFGEGEAKRFLLLPSLGKSKRKKYRLEDLFDIADLRRINKELSLPLNTGFEKTILNLKYAPEQQRNAILKKISQTTLKRIAKVFEVFQTKLKELE